MIDFGQAREAFCRYIEQYDTEHDKIGLKVRHTFGVVACADAICKRMTREGYSEEDHDLALVIALLHDIGRFEQLKRYDSFSPEVMDHAAFGVQYLFEDGAIRDFVSDPQYDELIRSAIAHHSDYALPEGLEERTAFHARLIRDADKLDNCRVKLEESIEVLLDVSPQEAGASEVTPAVWEQFCQGKCITSSLRNTPADLWLSYVAYFFDINFPETWQLIAEADYVHQIIWRLPYQNEATRRKMEQAEKMIKALME